MVATASGVQSAVGRRALVAASLGLACAGALAQSPASDKPPADPLFAHKTADAVLAALTPPASLDKLESGNELLLDVPDVVRDGDVTVHLVSVMPRTQQMWLLTLRPDDPANGSALLAKFKFQTGEPPEACTTVTLATTQTLLLVALAGGRYFGVKREVKVGAETKKGPAKP
jgi:hypothetical protein